MAKAAVQVDETETPEPEVSLRDQLTTALDESQTRQQKELEAEPAKEPLKAETPPEEPTEPVKEPVKEPEVKPTSVAYPAPRSWADTEKPLWTKVPPEVQAVINRRETEFHRKVAEQDEVRSAGTQFMTVANKYAPVIQARGTTPAAYFEQLLGMVAQIDSARTPQDRAAVFQQIAAAQGVDLRSLLPQGTSPPQQVPLQTLVQQSVQQQFEQWQSRQAQEQEQAVMQATTGEIEAFRSKVNDAGLPAYPYFDHVVNLMAGIVQSGGAGTLEEAYNLAVRAHPETSKLLSDAEQASQKAAEAKRLAAEKAKRKGGSIRGGPGNNVPKPEDRSIRDELRSAFEEARSRI
jgi:hypothetical protein